MTYFDIVLDGPPGPDGGRFVEVEDAEGRSFNAGEWIQDGRLHRLRIQRGGALEAADRLAELAQDVIAKMRPVSGRPAYMTIHGRHLRSLTVAVADYRRSRGQGG